MPIAECRPGYVMLEGLLWTGYRTHPVHAADRRTEGARAGVIAAVRNDGKDDPSFGAWEPGSAVSVCYKSASCTVCCHCKILQLTTNCNFCWFREKYIHHLKSVNGKKKKQVSCNISTTNCGGPQDIW